MSFITGNLKTSIVAALTVSITVGVGFNYADKPALAQRGGAGTFTDSQGRPVSKDEYDGVMLMNEATQLLNQNKNAEAVFRLERAVQLAPNVADVHYNYGISLAKMGRTEEALQQYQEATKINPQMPFAWMNLGASYQLLGKIEDAVGAYTEFVTRFPSNPETGKIRALVQGLNKELGRQTSLPAQTSQSAQQQQQAQFQQQQPQLQAQQPQPQFQQQTPQSSASPGLSEWQGSSSSSSSSSSVEFPPQQQQQQPQLQQQQPQFQQQQPQFQQQQPQFQQQQPQFQQTLQPQQGAAQTTSRPPVVTRPSAPVQSSVKKPAQVASSVPTQGQARPATTPGAAASPANSAAPNYLNEIGGAKLGKWAADRMPLRVCILPAANVKGYQPSFDQLLIKSFQDWGNQSGGKLSFKGVSDPKAADIVCTWTADTSKFMNSAEAGETIVYGSSKGIHHCTIQILTVPHPMSPGLPMSEPRLRWICLHEIGHSLGLGGHTRNPQDIMFFSAPLAEIWKELTPRDINTIQSLYSGR
ncbi:MAG: tetratricopeptide repeat protein [Leptolyngbya sp.]|nr:tetratricopeptide repeat protein [Candidatus Melainabacteria bacterium]